MHEDIASKRDDMAFMPEDPNVASLPKNKSLLEAHSVTIMREVSARRDAGEVAIRMRPARILVNVRFQAELALACAPHSWSASGDPWTEEKTDPPRTHAILTRLL